MLHSNQDSCKLAVLSFFVLRNVSFELTVVSLQLIAVILQSILLVELTIELTVKF